MRNLIGVVGYSVAEVKIKSGEECKYDLLYMKSFVQFIILGERRDVLSAF